MTPTRIHIPAATPRKKATKKRFRAAMIIEISHFVTTATIIFVFVFIALNFSAFSKQIGLTFDTQKSGNLAASVVTSDAHDETKNETSRSTVIAGGIDLPALDVAVAPMSNFLFVPSLDIRAPIREAETVQYLGDWTYVESQIQETLKDGVAHFPGTATPGERGNAFITGHSSYYPWDNGRYKDVFATLHNINVGDDIIVYADQQKLTYRVSEKKEVSPADVNVLAPTHDYRLTLMTCTPLGTTLRRLIVTAELVTDAANAKEVASR